MRAADEPLRAKDLVDLARLVVIAIPMLVVGWRAGAPPVHLALAIVVTLGLALYARSVRIRRLRTMSAVLAAYREGDFSVRARETGEDVAVDDVLVDLNALGDTLRDHRLGEMEAWSLLRKVMSEIDVVVLSFETDGRVRLANEAASRLIGLASSRLVGKSARELGLDSLLAGEAPRVVSDLAALGERPFELRRGTFRLAGVEHTLLVLSDMTAALREREQEAWKRIISVMGHEINNSLAPIESIVDNVSTVLAKSPRPDDWEADVREGLEVVARRSRSLGRFMSAYARLAKLPPPVLRDTTVDDWVTRVVALGYEDRVKVAPGPAVHLRADGDQLEALLINLVKNAVEAAPPGTEVGIRWTVEEDRVHLFVEDEGPGVAEASSLFVPFFTTKPGGSGIGLALARQIAEAHGGEVGLRTREGGRGAEATVILPIARGA